MASGQSSCCEALRTSTHTNSRWGDGQPLSSTCIHTHDCIFTYTCVSTHANTQLHTHSHHTYVCKEKNSWESSRVRARRLWYWCQSVKAKLISFCRCFSRVCSSGKASIGRGVSGGTGVNVVIVIISMYMCPSLVSVSGYCVYSMDWVSFLSNYIIFSSFIVFVSFTEVYKEF